VKKKRKHGAPKRRRNKARIGTPTRQRRKNPPSPLDNATIHELEHLVSDAPEEAKRLVFDHHIRRWDDPPDTTARRIVIDMRTKQTMHYIQRGGKPQWYLKDNAAKRPANYQSPRR
jgi:hypothetical protein